MKIKEKIITFILIPLLVLAQCLVLVTGVMFCVRKNAARAETRIEEYEIKNFRSNLADFQLVANRLLEIYDELNLISDDGPVQLISSYGANTSHWVFSIIYESKIIPQYTLPWAKSEREMKAYQTVLDCMHMTLGEGPFDQSGYIHVYPDRVLFLPYRDYDVYSLIYMRNGGQPVIIAPKNDAFGKAYFEELAPNWYQGLYTAF